MNIASLALSFFVFKARAFENAAKDPVKAQEKVLFEFLLRNRNTEYGLKYNFSSIKSIADYQRKVPLSDCETMRPFMERMTRGEQNILTADRPVFFGVTSGTTAIPKYVPTTKYSESKKAELLTLWSYYISRDYPDILDGKILAIVSPAVEGYTESGIPYGAESGYGYEKLPPLIKNLYVLPYEVFEITDYEARYYSMLRISMEHNVTNLATLNPSTIILLCEKIKRWQDIIIDDIENGTLDKSFKIEAGIRKALERRLRANPKRADELKKILKDREELLPKHFWPNMRLIECWKAGTVNLYLKGLPRYFGDVHIRDLGCLSTEARSSMPLSDEGAGGVLAIQTNFYEFIPVEDIDKKDKRVLSCGQLEKNKDYFIVVTTPGGLYRYNIDDIIRVDGFFNRAPVIEFVQKGHNATSLAGEKLYESQVNKALNIVLEQSKLFIKFFCAFTQPSEMPRYEFLAEFSGNPSLEKKKEFLRLFENELGRQNREYLFVRQSQVLDRPVLKVVRGGEFEKYRDRKVQGGAHDGQFKAPELSSDLDLQNNFAIEEEIFLD